MPLFGKKKKDSHSGEEFDTQKYSDGMMNGKGNNSPMPSRVPQSTLPAVPPPDIRKPKYKFHCQLAHGSPTGIISGFTNVKELYKKITECFNISYDEILFCTLNTHKVDMEFLLGGQIALDDFIFAHIKGQKKEIDLVKSEDALGLTITDNGAGLAFIKRIKDGSVMDRAQMIEVGDHIEKIDGESFVGKRHFDVARQLKDIPKGATFTLRLVSPEKTPFSNLGPRSAAGTSKAGISSGKKTLRLRAGAEATEEEAPSDVEDAAIKAINRLIESLLGIDDEEMAQRVWELGRDCDNPHSFSQALDVEMGSFGFSDNLIFDFWGAITDAKAGRLPSQKKGSRSDGAPVMFNEQF